MTTTPVSQTGYYNYLRDSRARPLPVLPGLFRLVIADGEDGEENCDAATFAEAVEWAEAVTMETARPATLEHDLTGRVLLAQRTSPRVGIAWHSDRQFTTPQLFAETVLADPDFDVSESLWMIVRPNGCVGVDWAADEVAARATAEASRTRYNPSAAPYRVEPTPIG